MTDRLCKLWAPQQITLSNTGRMPIRNWAADAVPQAQPSRRRLKEDTDSQSTIDRSKPMTHPSGSYQRASEERSPLKTLNHAAGSTQWQRSEVPTATHHPRGPSTLSRLAPVTARTPRCHEVPKLMTGADDPASDAKAAKPPSPHKASGPVTAASSKAPGSERNGSGGITQEAAVMPRAFKERNERVKPKKIVWDPVIAARGGRGGS
ncbi:hypothetical protein WJX73_004369 [Symbiochloris irregularis]|uniref:Uncharacterized protein n=1 Tax=Symbiochloris irregularis TaxID=706552 RepID=A0AAW1PZQ2_9CHLO